MINSYSRRKISTGTAGVISFRLAHGLLQLSHHVSAYNGSTDSYDVAPKEQRLDLLLEYTRFTFTTAMLERAEECVAARVARIGNTQKTRLVDFIEAIGTEPGKKAIRNDMSIKVGDLPATRADARLLDGSTDCLSQMPLQKRGARIASRYRDCYWK